MKHDPWEIAYLCSLGLLLCAAVFGIVYVVHLAA